MNLRDPLTILALFLANAALTVCLAAATLSLSHSYTDKATHQHQPSPRAHATQK
jgi:hypothetical protein